MKVGIAVTTTHNREKVFQQWYDYYRLNCPELPLYPHTDTSYKGVVYSKNKCISTLMGIECDHLFLFDDDCFINSNAFIDAYINSGLEHACWNLNRQRLGTRTFGNNKICLEYEKPNGCMLYVTKKAVEIVGGFDPDFMGYGYEHPNWSDRIFNNGLTPARYVDIPNSSELFTMADCESSFSLRDRAMIPRNYALYQEKFYSKEFIDFK